jgi:hypothetical protein
MIGPCRLDFLQKTAKIHGLKLYGDIEVCEDVVIAKARQKNMKKVSK